MAKAAPPLIPGRIVHYMLSLRDAMRVRDQRFANPFCRGNEPHEGDVLPLTVVRVWKDEFGDGRHGINGQVSLDGNDLLWVTSVCEGDAPGEWHWPRRD